MWSSKLALILSCGMLAGCGFEPIYSGARGQQTVAEFATVKIDRIEERTGQILRNYLLDSINPRGEPQQPMYILRVEVAESKGEIAVRKSELATRANLSLTASYRLLPARGETPIMARSSAVTASYNLLTNEFATLSAEADARERSARELSEDITRQLALYFRSQSAAGKK